MLELGAEFLVNSRKRIPTYLEGIRLRMSGLDTSYTLIIVC